MTIDSVDDSNISNQTVTTNRISNRTYDSKSNRITKLRRALSHTQNEDDSKLSTMEERRTRLEMIWNELRVRVLLLISYNACLHFKISFSYTFYFFTFSDVVCVIPLTLVSNKDVFLSWNFFYTNWTSSTSLVQPRLLARMLALVLHIVKSKIFCRDR